MANFLQWMVSPDGTPVDRNGESVPRQFLPDFSATHCRVPRSERLWYSTDDSVLHIRFMGPEADAPIETDTTTVVMYIDGACLDDETRAGWGLFLGPSSMHNARGRVDEGQPQTKTYAVIQALDRAIHVINELIMIDELDLRTVLIASHSQYVVTALSLWIELWIENGGLQLDGEHVSHFKKLRELHERIIYIEEEYRVFVKFWPVGVAETRDARVLAKSTLSDQY